MVLKRLGVRHDGDGASGTDCCPRRWFLFATKQRRNQLETLRTLVTLFDFDNFTLIEIARLDVIIENYKVVQIIYVTKNSQDYSKVKYF